MERLNVIQKALAYAFKNKALLAQALVRKSYYEENKELLDSKEMQSNEILEFLGDSVLNFIISSNLVLKNSEQNNGLVCKINEGELSSLRSALVKKDSLAEAITRLGFEKYLYLSEGDINNNVINEPSVKEDLFEAIVGAVAIDSNFDYQVLRNVIANLLSVEMENTTIEEQYVQMLTSYAHKNKTAEPTFKYISTSDNMFRCVVTFDLVNAKGIVAYHISEGKGKTKQAARQEACKNAWTCIEKHKPKAPFPVFTVENAINVLQELQHKKIVTDVEYNYDEKPENTWDCILTCDDFEKTKGFATSKKEAKKLAAYEMLKLVKIVYEKA